MLARTLAAQRQHTGFEDGNYGLPAGHLEPGESVLHAAIRECREEIGIELAPSDLRAVGVTHYTSPAGDGVDFFFCAIAWRGKPTASAECSAVNWYPLDGLPHNTIPFVRRAIEQQLLAGNWFDQDGWASCEAGRTRPVKPRALAAASTHERIAECVAGEYTWSAVQPHKRAAAVMACIRRDTHELAATEEELYAFE